MKQNVSKAMRLMLAVTMEDIENTAKLLTATVLAGPPAAEGGAV